MEKKEVFSFSINQRDFKDVFKAFFEQMGYKNVKIKSINHNIDFIPFIRKSGNRATVALDLNSSLVSFESTGLVKDIPPNKKISQKEITILEQLVDKIKEK